MADNLTGNQETIDITVFVAEAISRAPKGYGIIDDIYKKNKYEFYKYAIESEHYNSTIINDGALLQTEYARKMLGILLYMANTHTNEYQFAIVSLVKTTYPYVWSYVNNHTDIHFSEFLEQYVKKRKGIDNVGDDELNCTLVMLLFLSLCMEGKNPVPDKTYNTLFNTCMKGRLLHAQGARNIQGQLKEGKELIKEIISAHCKGYSVTKLNNLCTFKEYDKRLRKYDFLFDFFPLSSVSLIESTKHDPAILQKLVASYIAHKNITTVFSVDKEDLHSYIIHGALIYKLAQAYDEAKTHYFSNNKETMFVEVEKIKSDNAQIENENIRLNNLNSQLAQKITEVERTLKRVQKENEELRKSQIDLVALRELAFSLTSDQEDIPPEIGSLDKLKDTCIVVIGGRDSWQRKLKEFLPNSIFINADMKTFDIRVLDGNRHIFFNTRYLSHSLYYRAINNVCDSNVLHYFSNDNIEFCFKEIMAVVM